MLIPRSIRQLIFPFLLTLSFITNAHAITGTESAIYTFSGSQPSPLIQASDGNFYGTSSTGGSTSLGYVFRLTPSGTMTVLYNFTGNTDGGTPMASLIEGNDGNLYGTNTTGGGLGKGVLFRLTLGGSLTVLHNFATGDGTSAGALIQNNAGDIFGAATTGGSANQGTVFEYSSGGVFSVLHNFTGVTGDGARPNSQLLQASDGLIYGVTVRGGVSGSIGSLFRFDPADLSSFTTFGTFPPTGLGDPYFNPIYGLTEGPDGALYGLTAEGGNTGYGTVYKVILGSTPTLILPLYSFVNLPDGGLPESGLTLGGDGNFYGTTSYYGPGTPGATGEPRGTIFQFSPTSNTPITLYGFSAPYGQANGAPIEAFDGNLYGPASAQVYKLELSPAIAPPIELTANASSITLGQSVTLNWVVNNAFSQTAQNCYAHGSWGGSQPLSGTEILLPASTGTYTYALTCGGVESSLASVTVTPPVQTQTATPVITPAGGTFNGPVAYNIKDATPGATIYYTTDGTTPTTSSAVWGGIPVVTDQTITINAVALANSMTLSNVATATLTINHDPLGSCTIQHRGGFESHSDIQLNHSAHVLGNYLFLTNGLLHESNSAFDKKLVPLKTFVTEFFFRFLGNGASQADGMTFTLQTNSPSAVGGFGSGLGYSGITHSMALKFDLHNNAGEGNNSVGLFFGGASPTVPAIDLTPSGIDLHSGHIMDAYVSYDGKHLTLHLRDVNTNKQFNHVFNMPSINPFGSNMAFAGFTGGTGSLTTKAEVLSWWLDSAGSPCK